MSTLLQREPVATYGAVRAAHDLAVSSAAWKRAARTFLHGSGPSPRGYLPCWRDESCEYDPGACVPTWGPFSHRRRPNHYHPVSMLGE